MAVSDLRDIMWLKNEAQDILKQIKEEHSRNVRNKGNVNVENNGSNSGIMSGINSGEIHR